MIPYSILSAVIHIEHAPALKVRMIDLFPDGFTFRLALKYDLHAMTFSSASITGLTDISHAYQTVSVNEFAISPYEDPSAESSPFAKYYRTYRFTTANRACQQIFSKVSHAYLHYIRIRTEYSEEEMMEILTGLKTEHLSISRDASNISASSVITYASTDSQLKRWFHTLKVDESYQQVLSTYISEFALGIDSVTTADAFLQHSLPAFIEWYRTQLHLDAHPLLQLQPTHMYIGNDFCPHRLPGTEKLIRLFDHCLKLHVIPVMVFPPMQEHMIPLYQKLLCTLSEWAIHNQQRIELVINDFGLLHLIKAQFSDTFILTAGRMFTKRKKDTRLSYIQQTDSEKALQLCTSIDASSLRSYMSERYQVDHVSYESVSYNLHIEGSDHTLYLPFYQMNTATFCGMYAYFQNNHRGCQEPVKTCPGYCEKYTFVYPDNRFTLGIGNTLLGLDKHILMDADYLEHLLSQNIKRIVFSQ